MKYIRSIILTLLTVLLSLSSSAGSRVQTNDLNSDSYAVLYEQDFESVSNIDSIGWTYGGSDMTIESDAWGKFIRFSQGQMNARSAQLTWGRDIFFKHGSSVLPDGHYRLSYDFCIEKGSNNQYNSEFTVFTNHTPIVNNKYFLPWSQKAGSRCWENWVFDMNQNEADKAPLQFYVDAKAKKSVDEEGDIQYTLDIDSGKLVTFSEGTWYTVILEVNVNERTVEYSIVSLDGATVVSGTHNVPETNVNGDSISMYAEGLYILLARYGSVYDIDNIKISCKSADSSSLVEGDDFEYDGIWYTVLDAEARTCKTKDGQYDSELPGWTGGNTAEGDVVIPSTVSYGNQEFTVVGIGTHGFMDTDIVSIVIPETVTTIENGAFFHCFELTSVSLPESLTSIGMNTFDSCEKLTAIHLPDGLTKLDACVFEGCRNLSVVNMPKSLVEIEGGAFNLCALPSLDIPEGVESIGFWAFQSNPLTYVSLPASLKSIETEPFNHCWAIENIDYAAEKPQELEPSLFEDAIYEKAILNAPNATLDAILATGPWNRFIRIKASDASIGLDAPFKPGEEFDYDGIHYSVVDPAIGTCRVSAPNKIAGSTIEIPEKVSYESTDLTVVEIGAGGFEGAEDLTDISLPSTVETVGEDAFKDCVRLSSLIWRGNLRMPDDVIGAFDNPNLIVYVDSLQFAPESLDHNVVAEGACERLELVPGYPFHPAADFTAKKSSLTKDFTQQTPVDGCAGWETLVLPFNATKITGPDGKSVLPFAAVTDVRHQRPFWLYEADPEGEWTASSDIKGGVPYVISMPNNPRYNPAYNINGPVTFANPNYQKISAEVAKPDTVIWSSGREFRSVWMPMTKEESEYAMGLNAGMSGLRDDNGVTLAPGSAFCVGVVPKPFEAYVTRIDASAAFLIKGLQTAVLTVSDEEGLRISQEGTLLVLRSGSDLIVEIHAADGTLLRRVFLRAGQPEYVDALPQGVCIIAGRKFIIR